MAREGIIFTFSMKMLLSAPDMLFVMMTAAPRCAQPNPSGGVKNMGIRVYWEGFIPPLGTWTRLNGQGHRGDAP